MFGKRYVHDLIERSAENPAGRRRFLKPKLLLLFVTALLTWGNSSRVAGGWCL